MILWIHTYRSRPGWYEQDAIRREELTSAWELVAVSTLSATTSRIGPLAIRGQSSQERVEIWQFPSLQDLDDYWVALRKVGYADWIESENTVATNLVGQGGTAEGS